MNAKKVGFRREERKGRAMVLFVWLNEGVVVYVGWME